MDALLGKKKEHRPGGALVLYTTRHGATQRYAERIAQPLDALVKEATYAKIARAKTYDAIVLGCPVYMGKLKGLDFFADNMDALKEKRLVLFTCGLYDPAQEDVRRNLEDQIRQALGDAAGRVAVFHLRGALRWQSLGLMERLAMKAIVGQIRKKDEAQRSEMERLMLETEGGALDFSDEADLGAIVRAARFGREADA